MYNRKAGIAFVGMGAVLMIAALLLFLYNEGSNAVMEEENRDIYEELYRIIEQQKTERAADESPETPEETELVQIELLTIEEEPSTEPEETLPAPVMMLATVDGYDYIGILEIPALELAVPILSDWDEKKLDIAPCRHFGSVKTDDLVIAGHNYRRHFLNLYKLVVGDTIRFTGMDGSVIDYRVTEKWTLEATDVDTVLESEYDLILYTCTYSGTERTAVFCERTVEG